MKTIVLPFLRNKGDVMKAENKAESRNEEPKKRSIILPAFLWDITDKDAKRCKRSTTKQIEAILSAYYNVEADVDLDKEAVAEAFHAVSQKRTKVA